MGIRSRRINATRIPAGRAARLDARRPRACAVNGREDIEVVAESLYQDSLWRRAVVSEPRARPGGALPCEGKAGQ
jgi:hypothetical protein